MSRPDDDEAPQGAVAVSPPRDQGALPVATFSEDDLQIPPAPLELPSTRWRRRGWRRLLPVTLAAAASAIGLAIVGATENLRVIGVFTAAFAPIVIGTLVSLFPRGQRDLEAPPRARTGTSVGDGLLAAAIVMFAIAPTFGEGALCVALA